MTTEYLTEQEQIQQLKNWVKQYGPTVLVGILLAIALTTGWHYWQTYQNNIRIKASNLYTNMLTARAEGKSQIVQTHAENLITHYSKTPYASLAALMLAREAIQNKNSNETITRLNWVIDHSKDAGLREIARLRIARLLIADKKPQDALNILETIDDKTFMGLAHEIKGDAYLALNQPQAARKAYEQALKELPQVQSTRPILQMKFDNLTAN